MNTKANEYKSSDVLRIAEAQDFILGEKVLPFLDFNIEWPFWYRPEAYGLYEEDE